MCHLAMTLPLTSAITPSLIHVTSLSRQFLKAQAVSFVQFINDTRFPLSMH